VLGDFESAGNTGWAKCSMSCICCHSVVKVCFWTNFDGLS